MKESRPKSEDELRARLEELKLEYEVARLGLEKGGRAVNLAFVSGIITLAFGAITFITAGVAYLSGSQFIVIVLILALSLIIYFSFIFGRVARLRAEITKTKKSLEISSGDKVR